MIPIVGTLQNHSVLKTEFISFKSQVTNSQMTAIWYIVIYCFLNFILEIIQLIQDGREYFYDIENYIQWTLYITTSIFTFPFLFDQSWHYQWVAGSICIFTAYLALLFLLARFDIYGIYVIMFLEIMKTLLHVSIVIFNINHWICINILCDKTIFTGRISMIEIRFIFVRVILES